MKPAATPVDKGRKSGGVRWRRLIVGGGDGEGVWWLLKRKVET